MCHHWKLLPIVGVVLDCCIAHFIFWDHVEDTVLGGLAFLAQRVFLLAVRNYEFIEGLLLVQSGLVLRTGLVYFVLGLKIIILSSFTVSHESAGF